MSMNSHNFTVCLTYEDVIKARRLYAQRNGLHLTFSQCIFQKNFQENKAKYEHSKAKKRNNR